MNRISARRGASLCVAAFSYFVVPCGSVYAAGTQSWGVSSKFQAYQPSASSKHQISWFKGSVEDAFAEARASNRPIFLYWGAVWCPSCTEVKSHIFAKPEFAKLVKNVVPVYLDGDTEQAQIWGEKLKISGYPTLLLLNSEGKEVLRFNETANLLEFQTAFENALQSLAPFKETLDRLLAQTSSSKTSHADWLRVSQFNWEDPSSNLGYSDEQRLFLHMKLFRQVPIALKTEKALLAGSLLDFASRIDAQEASKELKELLVYIGNNTGTYLEALFQSPQTIVKARKYFLYSTEDIIKFVSKNTAEKTMAQATQKKLRDRWGKALAILEKSKEVSVDAKLAALYATVQLIGLETKLQNSEVDAQEQTTVPVTQALASKIRASVIKATTSLTSPYERHSVVLSASQLLQKIGDIDAARQLLLTELKTSFAPWYFEASLAGLEEDLKNYAESLRWSEASTRSVEGNSSKLQWLAADIMRQFKFLNLPETKQLNIAQSIKPKLETYYRFAVGQMDGFSGRSASRQKRLVSKLKPWLEVSENESWFREESRVCEEAVSAVQEACKKHFEAALKSKKQI